MVLAQSRDELSKLFHQNFYYGFIILFRAWWWYRDTALLEDD